MGVYTFVGRAEEDVEILGWGLGVGEEVDYGVGVGGGDGAEERAGVEEAWGLPMVSGASLYKNGHSKLDTVSEKCRSLPALKKYWSSFQQLV